MSAVCSFLRLAVGMIVVLNKNSPHEVTYGQLRSTLTNYFAQHATKMWWLQDWYQRQGRSCHWQKGKCWKSMRWLCGSLSWEQCVGGQYSALVFNILANSLGAGEWSHQFAQVIMAINDCCANAKQEHHEFECKCNGIVRTRVYPQVDANALTLCSHSCEQLTRGPWESSFTSEFSNYETEKPP